MEKCKSGQRPKNNEQKTDKSVIKGRGENTSLDNRFIGLRS